MSSVQYSENYQSMVAGALKAREYSLGGARLAEETAPKGFLDTMIFGDEWLAAALFLTAVRFIVIFPIQAANRLVTYPLYKFSLNRRFKQLNQQITVSGKTYGKRGKEINWWEEGYDAAWKYTYPGIAYYSYRAVTWPVRAPLRAIGRVTGLSNDKS